MPPEKGMTVTFWMMIRYFSKERYEQSGVVRSEKLNVARVAVTGFVETMGISRKIRSMKLSPKIVLFPVANNYQMLENK